MASAALLPSCERTPSSSLRILSAAVLRPSAAFSLPASAPLITRPLISPASLPSGLELSLEVLVEDVMLVSCCFASVRNRSVPATKSRRDNGPVQADGDFVSAAESGARGQPAYFASA